MRQLLLSTMWVFVSVSSFAVTPAQFEQDIEKAILASNLSDEQVVQHYFNRFEYGPNPTRRRFSSVYQPQGDKRTRAELAAFIARLIRNQLFNPASEPEVTRRARELYPKGDMNPKQLYSEYGAIADPQQAARYRRLIRDEIAAAYLAETLLTHNPLQYRLQEFWLNHFNVDIRKTFLDFPSYKRAISRKVFSTFTEMLRTSAKHPAMLVYLDNIRSTRVIDARNRGPNENYARELLELHTFGVGPEQGFYNQEDIKQVALILTGWNVSSHEGFTAPREFLFREPLHDKSDKIAMGVTYKSEGVREGDKLLQWLGSHRRVLFNVTDKFVRFFVSEDRQFTRSLRFHVRDQLLATGGDLNTLYHEVFRSNEFWSHAAYLSKGKRPLEYVTSALRATGVSEDTLNRKLVDYSSVVLSRMGQPLFRQALPTGYPDDSRHWLSANTSLEAIRYGAWVAAYRHPELARRQAFNRRELSVRQITAPNAARNAVVDALGDFFDLKLMGPRFHPSPRMHGSNDFNVYNFGIANADTVSGKELPISTVLGLWLGSKEFLKY